MSDFKMPDLNRVQLAGRLTRDPELRYLPSGSAVCKLGLAVSEYYKTKEGEKREETLFINVNCWNKTAEWVGQAFKKGRPVLVEGRLKLNEWDDKTTGQKRSTIEVFALRVQALDWEDRDGGGARSGAPAEATSRAGGPSSRPIEEPVPEDDIPF